MRFSRGTCKLAYIKTRKHWCNLEPNQKPWFDPKLKQNKQLNQKHIKTIYKKTKTKNFMTKNRLN